MINAVSSVPEKNSEYRKKWQDDTYNPICTTAHMPHQFTSIFEPIIMTSYYILDNI